MFPKSLSRMFHTGRGSPTLRSKRGFYAGFLRCLRQEAKEIGRLLVRNEGIVSLSRSLREAFFQPKSACTWRISYNEGEGHLLVVALSWLGSVDDVRFLVRRTWDVKELLVQPFRRVTALSKSSLEGEFEDPGVMGIRAAVVNPSKLLSDPRSLR